MRTRANPFKLSALAAALLVAYGAAQAQELVNEVAVGVGTWSNDRRQLGTYDGMSKDGPYLLLDADFAKRDDATGTWMGLKLRNFGVDNRELEVEWQRQGDVGIQFEYSRITRDDPLIFNTNATGIGTNTMRVPVAAIAPGTGTDTDLGTVRDRYGLKFFKNIAQGLNLNVSFRTENKEGARHWSRGGRVEFAVEPIDSTTRQLEATLNYSRDKLQLSGGMYLTSYENANKVLFTSRSNGTDPINLALPFDNQSWEVFANGGYNFTPTTRGSFKLSYSRVTQDEQSPFIGLGMNPRAPSSLNGRLDTTLIEAGITSKPMKDLSVVANLRYRDFADKTPLQQIVFTGADAPMFTTPFSYQNTVGKLEATYRLPMGYSILGGLEYNAQDRSFANGPGGKLWVPFRSGLDESTLRVALRKSMSEAVNGSLQYSYSDRDGSGYTLTGSAANPGQDLINPLNIANRKRDKWRGVLDWAPMDRVSLQFTLEDSRDKYSGLPFGLQKGTARLFGVDGSLQVSGDWTINAWISRDEAKAEETTQNWSGVINRNVRANTLVQSGTSFGMGVRGTAMDKLKLGGDVEQFDNKNQYRQDITVLAAGGALDANLLPLPDVSNKISRIKMFAQYPIQKNADLRFNIIYERWSTDDWSWLVFPAAGGTIPYAYGGTANDGTTVRQKPKESSTFAGIRYIYRFE